jgi:hypothetical protein
MISTPLIPAKAGIQKRLEHPFTWQKLGPRFRGDERFEARRDGINSLRFRRRKALIA